MVAAPRPAALLLAPEAPYPLHGGGALRTASLLHYLARSYDVDLVVFRQPGDHHPAKHVPPDLVRTVRVIELPGNARHLPARLGRNLWRLARRVPPLVDRFAGFHLGPLDHYRLVVIEHSWCAPYVEAISGARTVLDLHNIESRLHELCSATEPPGPATAHKLFARASLAFERRWLPRFDRLLTASQADAEIVRRIAPGTRVDVYPNALPLVPRPIPCAGDTIVFSGNLEYHPNIAAVRFFRTRIWPALRARHPSVTWRLVGRNPGAVARYTAGDPRIQVTGPVPDAVAELSRSLVAVVPLLAGSGTRFKILEAWAAGVPVVSTPIGAEGLPARDGEHLLLAESPVRFADSVLALLGSPELRGRIGCAGRQLYEREFTWDAAWRSLDRSDL